jgi:hypothetical protein
MITFEFYIGMLFTTILLILLIVQIRRVYTRTYGLIKWYRIKQNSKYFWINEK